MRVFAEVVLIIPSSVPESTESDVPFVVLPVVVFPPFAVPPFAVLLPVVLFPVAGLFVTAEEPPVLFGRAVPLVMPPPVVPFWNEPLDAELLVVPLPFTRSAVPSEVAMLLVRAFASVPLLPAVPLFPGVPMSPRSALVDVSPAAVPEGVPAAGLFIAPVADAGAVSVRAQRNAAVRTAANFEGLLIARKRLFFIFETSILGSRLVLRKTAAIIPGAGNMEREI